jgi:small conductance mechanosensitive channel
MSRSIRSWNSVSFTWSPRSCAAAFAGLCRFYNGGRRLPERRNRRSYNRGTLVCRRFPPVLSLPLLVSIDTDALLEDVLQTGARILIVLVLGVIAAALVRRMVTPVIRVAIREQMADEPEVEVAKRIETLSDVIYKTAVAAIVVLGLVTILPEFGIAVGPLIAGLGLVGLAVGFGAQNLVRDVINGTEILIENQFGRGDQVRLRTTTGGIMSGTVEDINLRRTMLRDVDGAAHFISHGSIEVSSNLTRGFSRVSFLVTVPRSADTQKTMQLIDRVGQELAVDPSFASRVRTAPRADGIDRLGDATVDIRISGVTEPGEQVAVGNEMQLRLKKALDEAEFSADSDTPGA